MYPNWYSDHSGLIAEGMSGSNTGVLAALSLMKGSLVLSLGLSISHGPSFAIDPRKAVTIETDSAPHMILYALEKPASGFHKRDLPIQRQFNVHSVTLVPNAPVAGFLFFPVDSNASHVTIVVSVDGELFRFPVAKDPNGPSKFSSDEFPSKPPNGATQADAPAPLNRPSARSLAVDRVANIPPPRSGSCTRNISFAVAEGGQAATLAPKFTAKWVESKPGIIPGFAFRKLPMPRLPIL